MIVVGSKRMLQYDDMAADEPLRVYDRGMDVCEPTSFGEHQLVCRSGDIVIPRVEAAEPLALELADFARSIRTGSVPRSDVGLGLDIVAALEAAMESMRRRGTPVAVASSARDRPAPAPVAVAAGVDVDATPAVAAPVAA